MNPRTPMVIDNTSENVNSENFPWSALFLVAPLDVICLFSDPEINSICLEGW